MVRHCAQLIVVAIAGLLLPGCQTSGPGYYYQAARGQFDLWRRQQPVARLVEAPSTPDELRRQLRLVLELREFARTNLQLPPGKQYLRYADLGRPSVVWNVSAAPPYSLEARSWWYPVAGTATYRGYFSRELAEKYARQLRDRRLETHVGGVQAYSTLGWFRDPVLNTFVFDAEPDIAELLFHELAHQRVFIPGDTEFNEAFATAVAEEGTRRWLRNRDARALVTYEEQLRNARIFIGLVTKTRHALENLYTNQPPKIRGWSTSHVEGRKLEILNQLRTEFAGARHQNPGLAAYSGWFQQPLNNALLNTVHTYHHLVPAFHRKQESVGMNLEQFYKAVESTRNLTQAERRRWLKNSMPAR